MKLEQLEKTCAKIEVEISQKLSNERAEHVFRVATEAEKIYLQYYAKDELELCKLKIAALGHDITKETNLKKQEETLNKIKETELDFEIPLSKSLWHAITGAEYLKDKYNITDEEILIAIRYHTTGSKKLTKIGKILYIADYIEPGRTFDKSAIMQNIGEQSLEEVCLAIAEAKGKYLKAKNIENTKETDEFMEALKLVIKNKNTK